MSISTTVRQCLTRFKGLERENDELPGLEDEHGRFRVWVGNIAAHRPGGRRSLEYRLRDSSNLQSMVVSLLNDLLKALDELEKAMKDDSRTEIGKDTRPTVVEQRGIQADSDDDDDEDAELFGILNEDAIQRPVTRALDEMHEIILCLLRFSMTLRNPARHDQIKESASTSTQFYNKWDIDHVQNKFPDAQDYLHERLGKAVSRHRQYFKYRKEHHSKLVEGLDDEKDAMDKRPSTIATSLNAPDLPNAAISKGDELETESLYSATSFAPTTAGEVSLRPPPLPESGREGGPFECPLCFGIVIAEDERSWRQHIYEDLPPYVCTYAECITANQRYSRRRDWQRHQATAHNRHWMCPYGCSTQFNSETGFQQHLVNEHGQSVAQVTQQRLLESCAIASNELSDLTCPLCQKLLTSSKLWMKHLGHHLEQLALHAIPQDAFTSDSENESAATGQSGRSSESSEAKGELDLEPTSNIEHSEGETSIQPEDTDKGIITESPKLKFKDAMGRRFAFPWDMCKTWTGMKGLVNEAFENIEDLREYVHQGQYDLMGPDGELILPRVWDGLIQPGWEITMHMWPRLRYLACIPCRRDKLHCDLGSVDNPHDPPCARCRRESKECIFASTENEDLGSNTDSSTPPVPSFSQQPNAFDDEDYGDPTPIVIERERKPYTPKEGVGIQYEDSRPISRTNPGIPSQAIYPSSSGPSDSVKIPSWAPMFADVLSRDESVISEDYSGTLDERPKDILDSGASASDRRTPVYPKIHRDYVEEATLKYYDVPYMVDKDDDNFVILLREMDRHETEVLFEHTRRLRAGETTNNQFTDEELKQKYGMHLATRLETDEKGQEFKWADIDDDEDDWAPETVEWMDGTKTSLRPQEAAPVLQEQKSGVHENSDEVIIRHKHHDAGAMAEESTDSTSLQGEIHLNDQHKESVPRLRREEELPLQFRQSDGPVPSSVPHPTIQPDLTEDAPSRWKRKGMWTEVTKDLVVKEAIERRGYDYDESDDFFYIKDYLSYEDVQKLVEVTEDIRHERRERLREAQLEYEQR